MTNHEHVCDPNGDPCPPWAHPYRGTDEVLIMQRLADQRQAAKAPQRRHHLPKREGQTDERLVSSMLGRVAGLVSHGYRLTDAQADIVLDLLGAGTWKGPAQRPAGGPGRSG